MTTNATCGSSNNGAIDITATGGTAPYTYNWGGGITTEDRTGLAAGTYTVTITDNLSATVTSSFTITVLDTDCDGVLDTADLDDDNDGILDTNEGVIECSLGTLNFGASNGPIGESGANPSIAIVGDKFRYTNVLPNIDAVVKVDAVTSGTSVQFIDNTTVGIDSYFQPSEVITPLGSSGYVDYTIYFYSSGTNTPAALSNLVATFIDNDANEKISFSATVGSVYLDNPTFQDVLSTNAIWKEYHNPTGTSASGISLSPEYQVAIVYPSVTSVSFRVGEKVSSSRGLHALNLSVCGSLFSAWNQPPNLSFPTVTTDTDGDGTPNHLDTDSDNDGCADAIEGGGSFAATSIDANNRLTGGVDANGVPTVATASGQTVGSSQNAAVKDAACTPLSSSITQTNVSCFGGSNGFISLTVSGGTAPFSYNWGGGITTQNRTGLVAGIYTVTVTDAASATTTATVTITQPAALTATGVETAITCTTGGAINLTAAGGTAPYLYDWADIAGTNNPEDRAGLAGGAYAVTVTDSKGCTATTSFNLASPACTPTYITVCKSNTADVFSVTPDPNITTYTWSVTGGGTIASGQGTPSVTVNWTGATVGTGSVCCKTVNNCGESANVCKDVYIRAPIAGAAVSSPVCIGSTMLLTGSGGVSYQWSGPLGFTSNVEAPVMYNVDVANAGTYTVTVTDVSGCTATASVAVTVAIPPSANSLVTDASCGFSNGAIDLSPVGGTAPFTYLWSNGATTQDLSNLIAAAYTATVTDANGCTVNTTINISNSAAQTVTLATTNVACFGGSTGQLTPSVTSGVAPFTYLWSNGSNTANQTGLAIGTYTVTVTGADGCKGIASATLTQSNELLVNSAMTHVNCIGGVTGAINITVTGGATPYTYNWGGGVTTEDRTGLGAGVYTVTVTDANGCTVIHTSVLIQPASPLTATTAVTNVKCNGGSTGVVNLTASGGTLPYTFLWTGGETTEDISNKAVGTYSVTVTDAKGCTATSSKTITEPAVLSLTNVTTDVSCNNGSTGAINLTVTGGTTPLSILWSNGATTEDLSAISAGTYGVTVTDANACTATASISVTQPTTLTAMATPTNPTCNGGTGSIAATIAGGTTAYTYTWSNGATTQNLTGVAAGTYILTVTDSKGCTAVTQATLTQPAAISIAGTVTNVACFGTSTGAISIIATNGVGALTYNWGSGVTSQNRTTIAAGTYTVTVTDASGCTASRSFVVAQPAAALAGTVTKTDIVCNGNADGSINLSATGGSAPYTYSWSNSATTEDISSLIAGTYTVTVTDAQNCTTTSTTTITQPAATSLSAATTSATCNGANDGAIDLTVTGTATPYTYNWSNGATTEDISSITGGNYNVTVTGNNGCPTTLLNITIGEIGTVNITSTVTHNFCASGNQGAINLTVTGGTAPLSYAWSNGATTKDISGLTAGTYTVVIRDNANCVKFYTFVITQPMTLTPLVLSAVATQPNCGASTGAVDLTVTGGLLPYNYTWSNSATTQDITGIAAGVYRVTVTDGNGCIQNYTSSVNSSAALTLTPTVTPVACKNGSTGSITTTISGGMTPYSYSWSNGSTSASLTGVVAGTYSVVVTDASGCSVGTSQTITEPTAGLSLTTATNAPNCIGTGGDAFVSPSGGTAPYTYTWSNGGTTEVIGNLAPATYMVTVTDAKGCTANISSTITAADCLPPVAVNDNFTTPLNTPITQTVAPNDSDPDGLATDLIFSLLTNPTPAQGVIDFDGTYGNFTFTPTTGFTGTVTLNYEVCDLTNLCTTGVLTISVSASILPITESGTSPSTGGTPVANVRSNDTVNGFAATSGNSTISQSGTWPSGITLNTTTGAITVAPGITPAVYPVTYQLCDLVTPTANCATVVDNITVTPVINPVTESGTIPSTGGTPIVNVRSNDFVNGVAATSSNSTIAQSGTWPSGITLNTTTGAITVASGTTPAVYPVTYQLCDLATPTANCATVVDNITVTPVINPVTESGSVTSAVGGTAIANVRTNDLVNGLAATSGNSTIAQSGTWPSGITLNTTTGAINVTAGTLPAVYPVTYQLCDLATPTANCATVVDNITVTGSINPVTENGSVRSLTGGIAIANVRTNDLVNGVAATSSNSTISQSGTWPSGITLNTTTGAISVTPGTAAAVYPVTYQLCDLATPTPNCATVVDNITVINNPPIAVNDIAVTPQDKPVTGNVLTNDDDPDSDPITAITTPISNPNKGTVVLSPNGVFTYTPNTGQTGEDRFCYAITDGALKDTACVTINIIPNPIIGNDKPVANDDATQTPMNTNVSINVKSNDTDPDGNATLGIPSPLSTTTVKGGTMTNNNDGTFTYAPPTGFIGKDSVRYRICDNGSPSLCDSAWVTIEVIPTPAVGNQPPVALDDAALTPMGTPVTIAIKTNDFDPDGGILGTPAVVTTPTNGSVVVNPDGTVTYTPTSPTFVGSDVFTYKICDNGSPSKCDTATVTVAILSPPPTATVVADMDVAGTIAGVLVNIPILSNDLDNGTSATLSNVTPPTITRNPTKGTASVKPDGTIDYTPNVGTMGSDTLIYQICDKNFSTTTCDTALVVINIGIRLLPRAYLAGCYNETANLMHDSLRRKNLIPLQQPYNRTEYSDNVYNGTESINASVLTTTGNNAIVDWVLVELRSPTDPKVIVMQRAALIQRDGDIVDMDGVSPVMFGSTSPASYYVSVKHRNHLGVLTALAQPLAFVPLVVDFTLTTTDNYKTTSLDKDFAQKQTTNNKRAMWMGNINKDNKVIFQGPTNDVGQLYLDVLTDANNGGFLANYVLNGYLRGDVDMDGQTIYQGPANEVDKIFFEVVLHPTNTTYLYNFIINEQIPR